MLPLNAAAHDVNVENFILSISGFSQYEDERAEQKQMQFINYTPYPIFKEFHRLGKESSIRLLLAANRIGKTYSCLAEFAMHATLSYPPNWEGHRYRKKNLEMWIGGITSFEATDLTKRLFEGSGSDPAFIHPSLIEYSNKHDRRYKIRNSAGGITNAAIKTYGGREQQNELSTWKSAKVDFILLDEQPTMSVFAECCMRIMNTGPDDHGMIIVAATCTKFTQFVLSFTQRVEQQEVLRNEKKYLEERQIKIASGEIRNSKVYLVAGWDDAQHLDEDQKKNLLASMLPAEIEARTKGMPSIGSGMVYPVLEELITCQPFEIPKHFAKIIGMDFGWTDPTALVFGSLDRDAGILYITYEYAVSGKTPDSHLADLQTMAKAQDLFMDVVVMCDPAGQASSQKDGESLMNIYRRKGIKAVKANNSRSAGILTVLQMMLDGRLKIFNSNHRLLNEIRTYAYNDKGEIIDGNDHLLDALRYMVTGLSNAGSTQPSVNEETWGFHNDLNDVGIM